MKEIITYLAGNDFKECLKIAAWLCGILGITIDCTPWIKLNPVRWLFAQLGKLLNGNRFDEIQKEMSELKDEIKQNKREQDLTRIKDLRSRILSFASSIPKGEPELEEYEEIFDLDEEYVGLLAKYNMTNGRTTRAMSIIELSYNLVRNV